MIFELYKLKVLEMNFDFFFFSFQETENNYADNEPTKKEQNCAVNLCVEIEESLQRSSSSE